MIPMAECEDRRLYQINSRNLVVGVYREATKGFIGIRTKFDSRYLFEEYHHEADPHVGTVQPERALDVWLPEEILLRERLEGTWCSLHDRPVAFENTEGYGDGQPTYEGQPRMKGRWFHVDADTPLDKDDHPVGKGNPALQEFLEPYDTAEHERWRAEHSTCSCAKNKDGSVTTLLCPTHAEVDPCLTTASVTGKRRIGTIRRGVCSACGWTERS